MIFEFLMGVVKIMLIYYSIKYAINQKTSINWITFKTNVIPTGMQTSDDTVNYEED